MSSIPDEFQDLFEQATYAFVATLTPEGFPHVTPVWIDYDADEDWILVNTERDRRKEQNVQQDPRVGVGMTDPADQSRALTILGEVDEITEEGAREHIDELALRYFGSEFQSEWIQTSRVLLKIRPEEVIAHGAG